MKETFKNKSSLPWPASPRDVSVLERGPFTWRDQLLVGNDGFSDTGLPTLRAGPPLLLLSVLFTM